MVRLDLRGNGLSRDDGEALHGHYAAPAHLQGVRSQRECDLPSATAQAQRKRRRGGNWNGHWCSLVTWALCAM